MSRDIQRWAGASFYRYQPGAAEFVDCWFELHPDIERLRDGWLGWATKNQLECVLQEKHSELKNSTRYPIEPITANFGRYFTSTAAYMIALAIDRGAEWIGLFGLNMAVDTEYVRQRPCVEYMVGVARGMGIEVHCTAASPLLRCDHLYGYEKPEGGWSAPVHIPRYADITESEVRA
jgi:hypothetical protein